MQWVQPFGKNRDAPGLQWFQISHGMGYPRVALSPVIYFVFSSGSLTLPAITIYSESVCTLTVTSRTSNAFLTPDWAHSTPNLEPRDLWHPSHRKRTAPCLIWARGFSYPSVRDDERHPITNIRKDLDMAVWSPEPGMAGLPE